jgi:pimeloyl-ACP methyl ester carboxylesterase
MHQVKRPVLGICGADDPSPDKPELMRDVAHFRHEWIEGARRFTMMEYPDKFNGILQGFLDSVN